jgi:hypothetical protein
MRPYWIRQLCLATIVAAGAGLACKDDVSPSTPAGPAVEQAPMAEEATGSAFDEAEAGTETVHVAAAQRRAIVPSRPPLDISHLLLDAEVVPLVARQGELQREALAGKKPGPEYNALHYRRRNGTEFGLGLQVWKFEDPAAARGKLEELKGQYLGVESVPDSASQSFGARRAGIRAYLVAPDDKAYLIGLSCGPEACKDWKALTELSAKVIARL